MATFTLTDEERAMLGEAIDSHIYWQLSDERYRSNGAVREPGSDDDHAAAAIVAFEALAAKLAAGPKFVVMCRVSGGVTGTREAVLKRSGVVVEFGSEAEAAAEAARLTREANGPLRTANFQYWVEPR